MNRVAELRALKNSLLRAIHTASAEATPLAIERVLELFKNLEKAHLEYNQLRKEDWR